MKYYKLNNGSSVMKSPVAVPGAVEITKLQYDTFISQLPVIPKKKPLVQVLKERGIITQAMYDEVM